MRGKRRRDLTTNLMAHMADDLRIPLPTCGICETYPRVFVSSQSIPDDPHPICAGCGIRFGGTHAGGTAEAARGRDGFCAFCEKRRRARAKREGSV